MEAFPQVMVPLPRCLQPCPGDKDTTQQHKWSMGKNVVCHCDVRKMCRIFLVPGCFFLVPWEGMRGRELRTVGHLGSDIIVLCATHPLPPLQNRETVSTRPLSAHFISMSYQTRMASQVPVDLCPLEKVLLVVSPDPRISLLQSH